MTYERVVGLDVTDDEGYEKYREGMTPILSEYGGRFGYDFRVSEVLKSKSDASVNRLFTIEFPDREAMEAFFADSRYKEVQKQFMEPSVAARTVISLHTKDN